MPEKGLINEEVTLQNICSLITDGKHGDCKNEDGSGYYFLSAKDVRGEKLQYANARQITKSDFIQTHKRTQLEPLDILISNSGTIGRMAIAKKLELTERTTFQKSVAILKPNKERVYPHWLFYCLLNAREDLISAAGGTAQKNLLLRDLRYFKIELPPLPTQRKITSVLSAYDDLIENNTRRIEILEEMAQRIYREWFVHFRFPGHEKIEMVESELGLIPEGWEVRSLGDVAEQVRRNVKPDQFHPETPYVGLEHIPRKSIALSEWGTAQEVQSSKLAFRKGEILFGKIRPYFHKVAVAPIDGLCSSDTIVISPKAAEHFSIVLCTVYSEEFVDHATQTSQGTKMPRADWNVLVKYPVAIPSPVLLQQFNELVEGIVSQIQNLVFRNRNLRLTRDLLLPKLVSGEVDVSNSDMSVEAWQGVFS